MGMKLKTLTTTRVSGGGGAPVVYSPLEYVPADVAQKMLNALEECREHMEWSTTQGKMAWMVAGYAIAAATEEE